MPSGTIGYFKQSAETTSLTLLYPDSDNGLLCGGSRMLNQAAAHVFGDRCSGDFLFMYISSVFILYAEDEVIGFKATPIIRVRITVMVDPHDSVK